MTTVQFRIEKLDDIPTIVDLLTNYAFEEENRTTTFILTKELRFAVHRSTFCVLFNGNRLGSWNRYFRSKLVKAGVEDVIKQAYNGSI